MNCAICQNQQLKGGYFRIIFDAPEIARKAGAGQFVHVRIGENSDPLLRRPFSIHDADGETGKLAVVYKVVGKGTEILSHMGKGDCCDLMGPLGNGYSPPEESEFPVIVAGGYGSAAAYLLAKHAKSHGALLLGAQSEADVILDDCYESCGFELHIATNDGSRGTKGLVTDLIDPLLAAHPEAKFRFYACGPNPMLIALAKLLEEKHLSGEISMDHLMCCGIGACFSCVVKLKDGDTWRYARSCSEGPVFRACDIYTGKD